MTGLHHASFIFVNENVVREEIREDTNEGMVDRKSQNRSTYNLYMNGVSI